jgi:hypothetical protein
MARRREKPRQEAGFRRLRAVGVGGQLIRLLGETNARKSAPAGRRIDAVAHQVAVALLHDVAEMNADAELNPRVLRHAGVALDHSGLDFDREAHGVDHASVPASQTVAIIAELTASEQPTCAREYVWR